MLTKILNNITKQYKVAQNCQFYVVIRRVCSITLYDRIVYCMYMVSLLCISVNLNHNVNIWFKVSEMYFNKLNECAPCSQI